MGYIIRQLLSLLLATIFITPVIKGQTLNVFTVTSKADKIFIDSIGNNFKKVNPKAYEVRTTNKQEIYNYYTVSSNKPTTVLNSSEYLVTYKIHYPDLRFATEVEILMDSKFKLKNSTAFENIPNYIKKNIRRDIITKDSAIKTAKDSGLASGDTLSLYLFKEYKTSQFFWTVQSEWKSYYAKLEKEYKNKGGPWRRRSRPKDELFVNAKTGEVLTYNQMPH